MHRYACSVLLNKIERDIYNVGANESPGLRRGINTIGSAESPGFGRGTHGVPVRVKSGVVAAGPTRPPVEDSVFSYEEKIVRKDPFDPTRPKISLGGRVLSAEIEYPRSRYLGRLETNLELSRAEYARRRSCDPGTSEAVSEYPRAEYARRRSFDPGILDAVSEYPRVEYARRRSFDPGISEAVRNI